MFILIFRPHQRPAWAESFDSEQEFIDAWQNGKYVTSCHAAPEGDDEPTYEAAFADVGHDLSSLTRLDSKEECERYLRDRSWGGGHNRGTDSLKEAMASAGWDDDDDDDDDDGKVTLYIDNDSTQQTSAGYSDSGFDWGEGFTATSDPDEATSHAEEIEIDIEDNLDIILSHVAEKCELCGELTEPLCLVAALRKYAAIREWLCDSGYITQEDVDSDDAWTPFTFLDDMEFEDRHSNDGGNIGLFLNTLEEVHGHSVAIEQAKELAKSKRGCPSAVNWLAAKIGEKKTSEQR